MSNAPDLNDTPEKRLPNAGGQEAMIRAALEHPSTVFISRRGLGRGKSVFDPKKMAKWESMGIPPTLASVVKEMRDG